MNFRSAAAVARSLMKAEAADKARARRAAAKALKSVSKPEPGPSSRISLGSLIALDRERRAGIPVTLPPIKMLEAPISDTDIGLADDPVSQERAVRFLEAAYAYKRREAQKAHAAARVVNVEIDDEFLELIQSDRLSSDDAMILQELQRIAAQPPAKWRVRSQLAS